jgi:Domain of unknown function (DUF3883)
MLQELKSFENLGTPKYFFELLDVLKKSDDGLQRKNLDDFFHNKIIDGKSIFDGCIDTAIKIGFLTKNSLNNIKISPSVSSFIKSERQICDKFVDCLLTSLKDNQEFHEIFSSQHISYDVIYHSVQVNNAAFTFKYRSFKQLLIDFDIIRIHPTKEIRKYIFNQRFKKIFDKILLPEIKKRKIGIDELRKELEQKLINGEEAELFVLEFEKRRLNGKEGIEWVAEYSVSEGFDILSFNSEGSVRNDRCIEVKSFASNPYFFWTRNEIDVSKIKGEEYFLYLIDREKIGNHDYIPLIIQNPYINILEDKKWVKEIEKYRIELIAD